MTLGTARPRSAQDPANEQASSVISGAGSEGVYCYLKHFALNEADTGRANLICTWADEQTMRELYLRPFEIALENARMTIKYTSDDSGTVAEKTMRAGTAVMASQTCVGTQLGHISYALLTEVLRDEWGFDGMVISDYWVWNGDNHRDLALRAGCDSYLSVPMSMMWSLSDYDSATARTVMREAIHRIAYAVANSNAMQGAVPGSTFTSSHGPWQYAVWGVTAVAALLVAGGVALIVRRGKAELADPAAYKRGKRAEAKLRRKLEARAGKA